MSIFSSLSNISKNKNIISSINFLLIIFSFFVVGTTVVETFRHHSPLPFFDEWVFIPNMLSLWNGEYNNIFNDLFSLYGEHRLFIYKMFFYTDYIFFEGKSIFLISSLFIVQFLNFIILIFLYRYDSKSETSLIIPATLVISMLFSVLQNDNFSWGLQISYAVVFTAASCAFLNYAFMLDRISRGKPFILPLLGMMLSMIIASLSIAIGIFVGIALIALSLLQRQRLYVFLLLLLITFTIFAFYMHGISSVRNYTYAFNHPFECIVFFFTYLGNPFVDNYEYGIPLIFGFLGFLFFLYGCWLVWTKKVFNPGQLSLLGVSIFIVSVVGMASLGGRSEGGIAYALSSRYITPILIFWSAQILFWMSIKFEDYQDNLRKWVLIFVCSSLCLTVAVEQFKLIFNTHPINRYNLIPLGAKRKVQSNAAADALISGVYDPDALLLTMPISEFWEVVQTSALTLKAHRRSLFSDPVALWVGSKLSDVLVVSPNVDTCQGAIEKIVPIVGSSAPNDARVMGWAWNNAARLPIERILLVNQENIIIGVASGGYASPSSSNTPKNIKSAIIGWHGFAKLPDDGIIRAFGVIRNGLEACPLSFER